MSRYCECCGREGNIKSFKGKDYCRKHYEQIKTHGFTLEENSRDKEDANEIIEYDDYCAIKLYDDMQEEIDDEVIIDKYDYLKVKGIRWDKNRNCITTKINNSIILLENYLLDTKDKVEFINKDRLDFRRDNLRIISKEIKDKKIDKRRKGKIDIVGYGASVIQVTSSSWGVFYDDTKHDKRSMCLIECGLAQGSTINEDYNLNKNIVDSIPFDRCGFMIFSHCHLDHLMNAIASIQRGFKGKVYMTKPQRILAEKLLLDGVYIHERNVKELKNKGKNAKPLYYEEDVYLFLNKVKIVEPNEKIKVDDNFEFRFRNNSHVLGAYQIEIWIRKPSNQVKKIVYSGDIGSNYNFDFQPFLKKTEVINSADLAIFESTYSNSKRSFTKKQCIEEREDLKQVFLDTIKNKSRCLIPVFSYSRAQLLMCMAYDWLKDCKEIFQIVVDSKLLQEINSAYREILEGEELEYWNKVMNFSRMKFVGEYKETLELSTKNDTIPRIIFSSSGFADAGRVRTWLPRILSNPNDTLCFVGYSSPNSLAGKIREQKDGLFIIDGIKCMRNCKIKTYSTYSSHIQQDELIKYFKQMSVERIILHHGDMDGKQELKKVATEELRKIGKTTKIICTDKTCNEFSL